MILAKKITSELALVSGKKKINLNLSVCILTYNNKIRKASPVTLYLSTHDHFAGMRRYIHICTQIHICMYIVFYFGQQSRGSISAVYRLKRQISIHIRKFFQLYSDYNCNLNYGVRMNTVPQKLECMDMYIYYIFIYIFIAYQVVQEYT